MVLHNKMLPMEDQSIATQCYLMVVDIAVNMMHLPVLVRHMTQSRLPHHIQAVIMVMSILLHNKMPPVLLPQPLPPLFLLPLPQHPLHPQPLPLPLHLPRQRVSPQLTSLSQILSDRLSRRASSRSKLQRLLQTRKLPGSLH